MLAFALIHLISVVAICVVELGWHRPAYPTGWARARVVTLVTFWPAVAAFLVARMVAHRLARRLACALARLITAHPESVAILRGDDNA